MDHLKQHNVSFDGKSLENFNKEILRRVQSTPLLEKNKPDPSKTCSQDERKKLKKALSISFRPGGDGLEAKPSFLLVTGPSIKELPKPDCIVQIKNRNFECNKSLLQKHSRMFSQIRFPVYSSVPLVLRTERHVYPEAFWLMYNWMNMAAEGDDFINIHWSLDLYTAAKYFDVPELLEKCYNLVTDEAEVKEEKAFLLYTKLHRFDEPELANYLLSLVQRSFLGLATSDNFLGLFWDELCSILRSDYIMVTGEVDVFYVGVHWLLESVDEREGYLEEVMSCVRFPHMSVKQMFKICQEFPYLTSRSAVRSTLESAVKLSVLNSMNDEEIREKYLMEFPKPRNSPYKQFSEQSDSYRMFLRSSRKARDSARHLYQNSTFLRIEKPPIVKEYRRLYDFSKLKSTHIPSQKTKSPSVK